jgi:hypothetical protein
MLGLPAEDHLRSRSESPYRPARNAGDPSPWLLPTHPGKTATSRPDGSKPLPPHPRASAVISVQQRRPGSRAIGSSAPECGRRRVPPTTPSSSQNQSSPRLDRASSARRDRRKVDRSVSSLPQRIRLGHSSGVRSARQCHESRGRGLSYPVGGRVARRAQV